METGTKVVVRFIPTTERSLRDRRLHGRLAYPYDGSGPVHLNVASGERVVVPAEQVRYVETEQ